MPRDEITTAKAAEILGVSTTTILNYVERGYLVPRFLPSGQRRYDRAEVEKLTGSVEAAS